MSLRDYFAAQALQGMLAAGTQLAVPAMNKLHPLTSRHKREWEELACWAYEAADAMLDERQP